MELLKHIKTYWKDHPLACILFLGAIVRLVAVFFSKGYGMLDDHFVVIEVAQGHLDGQQFNGLATMEESTGDSKRSVLYPGLHYYLFVFLQYLGLYDPQGKMYIVRFLHAAYSLIAVYSGYKITEFLSSARIARRVGLMLALLWLMPVLSVRNLNETVSMTLLVWASWFLIQGIHISKNKRLLLLTGVILGMAFSVRYQTLFFTGGIGLALLFSKRWLECALVALGTLFSMFLVHGFIEGTLMGYPYFDRVIYYVRYNMINATAYTNKPWYNYLLLFSGILIPPVSIMLFLGMFNKWRKQLLLFLPTFIFLAFHSYFPNKQERFILPILPMVIILGNVGWESFRQQSGFWNNRPKLIKGFWTFFWIINLTVLPFTSTFYTKRSRVESMTYLYHQGDLQHLLIENSNRGGGISFPFFYSGTWTTAYQVNKSESLEKAISDINNSQLNKRPNYFLFLEPDRLEERVAAVKQYFPNLVFRTKIDASFMDKVLHWLNPNNKNQDIYIYQSQPDDKKE